MYELPEVDGWDKDPTHVYQGVGIRNLEQAVLQGWVPVKEEDKVGKNWPVGPNGYRMFQEQVLCKTTKANWLKMQENIDEVRRALSIEAVEDEYRNQVGTAYGGITDG
jgi:hypothetical protein